MSQTVGLVCHRGMTSKPGRAEPRRDTDFAVLDELYPRLRRFAAVVADSDIDPDDLVQDALCATLRRHDLDELDNPAAYLKQAMIHAVASDRRRKSVWKRLLPRLVSDTQTNDHYESDLGDLDALSPLDRAVLFLVDVERLPHDLAAAELGLTSNAIRKRASRARAEVRASLRPDLSIIPKDGQ